MNKKRLMFISVAVVIISLCMIFVGCEQKEPIVEEVKPISYMQTLFYVGKDNEFIVKLIRGRGEPLFIADGKSSGNEEFTTLTVTPLNKDQANSELSFSIIGDNGEMSGILSYERLQGIFSSSPDLKGIGTPKTINIIEGKRTVAINLTNLLEGRISCEEALSIAERTLQNKLSADDKDREMYIRLINNSLDPNSEYYWYVAFIASPTDYYSALIDSKNGNVLSTNP